MATFATFGNALSESKHKAVDLTAIETDKQKAQVTICFFSMVAAIVLSMASFACGICLPLWVKVITPVTVWISMTLELLGYLLVKASVWINRNTL